MTDEPTDRRVTPDEEADALREFLAAARREAQRKLLLPAGATPRSILPVRPDDREPASNRQDS